jgi:mRNA interferase MazF
MVKLKRGDIWLANLDPTVGSEIQKTRPCVVVSPAEIHDWLSTALVAPMTTGSHPAPFRIPVSFGGKKGLILTEQIRALDKVRLVKRMGKVDAATLSALLGVLRDTFEE